MWWQEEGRVQGLRGPDESFAQQYVPPDKDLLQQAYAKGNIMLGPAAGVPTNFNWSFTTI